MSDPAHDDDDGQGDGPDTLDDRLAAVGRLVDTLRDETDPDRRVRHRAVCLVLLARVGADALARIAVLLERLENEP